MPALTAAVRPFAGGIPRRAAAVPSDASEGASSGKKRPRLDPAGDSAACLSKVIRNRSSVVTAAGEMPSQELLQKHLASELDVLRGLLQKQELISRRGACKGGAPTAGTGKKERFLASNQRPKPPIEEDSGAPSLKRTKISTPVEQKQKQKPILAPPQMSPEESKDDMVAEESKDDKVAEESKGKPEEEYADISGGLSFIVETGSKPRSRSSGDSDTKEVQRSTEARKVQDARQRAAPKAAVDMRALLYRANLRRQLLEKERAALPDQSIDPRELQRLAVLASRSVAIRASCASSGSSIKVVEA